MSGTRTPITVPDSPPTPVPDTPPTPYVRFTQPPDSPPTLSPEQSPFRGTEEEERPSTVEAVSPYPVEATVVVGAIGAPRKKNKRVRLSIVPTESETFTTLIFSPDFQQECPGAPRCSRRKLSVSLTLKNIKPFPLTFDDL